MPDSFGARLRRTREEQQIALGTIAHQTKIKLSLLEGLERDDVSHWPSGIFRRAYIRTYAQAIGLDPDVIVREFMEVHQEPAEVVTTEAIASAIGAARTGGPPTRLRNIVGSALESLSRLRRAPAVEEVASRETPALAAAGVEHGYVFSVPPVHELVPIEMADDAGLEAGLVMDVAPPALPQFDEPPMQDDLEPPAASAPVVAPTPARSVPRDSHLFAIARLCTELGCVESPEEVKPLLEDAAQVLDASGLIVWIWDARVERLRPALAHGYSDKVLAHIPTVRHDADNATAVAFRTAQSCAIEGGEHASGALVVPLLTAGECAGVLAIELQRGAEQTPSVRAVATIVGAALAQLVGRSRPIEAHTQPEPAAALFFGPAGGAEPGHSRTQRLRSSVFPLCFFCGATSSPWTCA
jgi:hypothetical protein